MTTITQEATTAQFRTFELKLDPTPQQADAFERFLWVERYCRNLALRLRITAYKHGGVFARNKSGCFGWIEGKSLSKYQLRDTMTAERKARETLSIAPAIMVDECAFTLHKTYGNFFKGLKAGRKAGFPRFKKQRDIRSFALSYATLFPADNPRVGRLRIQKSKNSIDLGKIKFRSEILPQNSGQTRRVVITKRPDGWYACLPMAIETPIIWAAGTGAVGIDLNIGEITCITTTGDVHRLCQPKHIRQTEAQVIRLQRKISRSLQINGKNKPRSNRYNKLQEEKKQLQQQVLLQRKAWQSQAAAWLVQQFEAVFFEDLRIQNMCKNRCLAKAISEQAWGQFRAIVKRKCAEHGRQYAEVSSKNTSKNCSVCGWKKEDLTLADRVWTCGGCGATHDRDANAARNVLQRGQALKLEPVVLPANAVVVPCRAVRPLETEITGAAPMSITRRRKARNAVKAIQKNKIAKKKKSLIITLSKASNNTYQQPHQLPLFS